MSLHTKNFISQIISNRYKDKHEYIKVFHTDIIEDLLIIRWKNSFHFSFLQTLNQFVSNEKNETIRSVDFLTNPNLLLFRNQVMTIK
jgi:hypothetical protein